MTKKKISRKAIMAKVRFQKVGGVITPCSPPPFVRVPEEGNEVKIY